MDTPDKRCPCCGESWPQTPEFWFRDRNPKRMRARIRRGEVPDLRNKCKSCTLEEIGHVRQLAARKAGSRRVSA
jgi:hypothetical protein